jgi:hypothetical protein
MDNVFSRSWTLTKLSFSVIKNDKELLIFPFLSAFFSLAVLALFWLPLRFFFDQSAPGQSPASLWISLFLLYFLLTLCSTFFSVCAVHIIKKRLEGGTEGLSESFAFAFSRIKVILAWSLLSATVSVVLRMLESLASNRRGSNPLNFIVNLLIGFFVMGLKLSWTIVTLFVVPAMVYKNLGPWEAIKDSTQTIKKTWGESLVRSYGLGLMELIFLVAGVVALLVLGFGLGSMTNSAVGVLTAVPLIVAYIGVLVAVFSLANTVFNTALYAYAATGEIPQGFSKDVLNNAFQNKE